MNQENQEDRYGFFVDLFFDSLELVFEVVTGLFD